MANGTPTWNGTDLCSDKTDLGNLGSTGPQAWNQFLDYISISANQNTNISTLKWYITGGNYLTTPGDLNIPNSIACPVLNDLPNFYQYHTRFFIANAGLGWLYTWTELLDTVNNANVITTTLTPTMGWEEVQDILFNEGDLEWHIVSQSDRCSCVGSISGGGVTGCMNPTATNYNPLATIDDGSCIGGLVPGCCDPSATNYDPLATCNDGSCEYNGGGGSNCLTCYSQGSIDDVPGCCDPVADNYDPLSTCTWPAFGGCQYTFDSWNCNECTTLTTCDGWNGTMGHLTIMSRGQNPIPRTDIGQTFTTFEEAREWYFDNPTVNWAETYFKVMSSTLTIHPSAYLINGVDWTGGAWGGLQWRAMNLFDHTNGLYGYPGVVGVSPSGPMTPFFVGGGGTAENVINWYMNEGLPVSQGMTWQEFKTAIFNASSFPWSIGENFDGSIVPQARCSDTPPMGCAQAPPVFTCEEAVGGSYATKQECIDAGC